MEAFMIVLVILVCILMVSVMVLAFARKLESPTPAELFKLGREEIEKIVNPLIDSITRLDREGIANKKSFEKEMANVIEQSHRLFKGTEDIRTALRKPGVRGSWGEAQLERVLELSGLRKGIDYETQKAVREKHGDESQRRVFDVVVNMPEKRSIILDSKVSLDHLMKARVATNEDERKRAFDDHVKQVKAHVDGLSRKKYHQLLENHPEYTVMVLPEYALLPAIEHFNGDLLDWAIDKDVIIVTPHTLIALLKSINLTWKQVKMVENVREITELGKGLSKRLLTFIDHFRKAGESFYKTVDYYNKANRSWNERVVPQVRRFQELQVNGEKKIEPTPDIQITPSTDAKTPDAVAEQGS